MSKKIEYSIVKKALIEAGRVFFLSFIAVVYAQFEAGVDLRDYKAWLLPLLTSAGVAGIKAVVKWLRESYFKGDYSNIIYKLPL